MKKKEIKAKLNLMGLSSDKVKIVNILRIKVANVVIVTYRRKTAGKVIEYRVAGFSMDSQHGGWDLITRSIRP